MRFRYRKIAVTVSVIVMGIGMVTLSTRIPSVDDSTPLEHVQAEEGTEPDKQNADTPDTAKTANMGAESDMQGNEAVETVAKDKGLEKNAYPEINELITAYMNAKLDCDEKKLAELVDDITYLDMTDIQRRTERIEEYTAIDCYTLAGPEEGSYMVYVYSEVKVTGIETLVSGLDGFYIRTDEAGKMSITMGEVPDEVSEQLAADSEREDVAQLIQDVNRRFTEEVENDEKLAEYYEELKIVDTLEKDQGEGTNTEAGKGKKKKDSPEE